MGDKDASGVFSFLTTSSAALAQLSSEGRGLLRSVGTTFLEKRLLVEDGVVALEDEEPKMDSVSDGAAVLLPKRFIVVFCDGF